MINEILKIERLHCISYHLKLFKKVLEDIENSKDQDWQQKELARR